jgi:tetratricopeptide (TPR) repeat protein
MSTNFEHLTKILEQKGVPPQEYYSFLMDKLKKRTSSRHLVIPQSPLLEHPLKPLGIFLLEQKKITLAVLNEALEELPRSQLSKRSFLQHLIRKRKIGVEIFLALEQQEQFPDISSSLYDIRWKEQHLEFYVKLQDCKFYGHYVVLEEIARGGMGIVYKAYHPQLNKTFALKVLIAGKEASQSLTQRFVQEIQTTAKLKHPGIVQVIDSGVQNGEYYFVMEYIEGKSLKQWLKEEHSLRERLQVFYKALEALHFAHTQGVLHRDLKPENILIASGEPKIMDFGLARDVNFSTKGGSLTRSGMFFGTPMYMSPEQASGRPREMDHRSDIYAMGVCLFELLTQQHPFDSASIHLLLQKIAKEDPLRPTLLNPEIHPDLETIIFKALEKSKEKRYATVEAFAEDLKRFLEGYPILAKPASLWRKTEKWIHRNWIASLFFSLLFFFTFLFILYWYWSHAQYRQELYRKELRLVQKLQEQFQPEDPLGMRIQNYLKRFSALQRAFFLYPQTVSLRQQKIQTGTELIQLACSAQNYQLARFMLKNLKPLLSQEAQSKLEAFLEKAQFQKQKLSEEKFQEWILLLRETPVDPRLREKAIFDISKMNSPKILQQLLDFLEEATCYFFEKPTENAGDPTLPEDKERLEFFYLLMVEALGRLENREVGIFFLKALEKMSTKHSATFFTLSELDYMVVLAEGLLHCKAYHLAIPFNDIRWNIGQKTLFWQRTISIYQDFFQRIMLNPKIVPDSGLYQLNAFIKESHGDFEGAIQELTKALALKPDDVKIYLNRGNFYVLKKDYPAALADFNWVLQFDPKDAEAYNSRGVVKQALFQYPSALEDFNQAIQLSPTTSMFYTNRGIIEKYLGNIDLALKSYEKAIELNPYSDEAYNSRGVAKHFLNRYEEAILDYSYAIKLNPYQARFYSNRGIAKRELQRLDEALEDFNNAVQIDPQLIEAYLSRGNLKRLLKDFQGALSDYQLAQQLQPDDPSLHNSLGLLARDQKRIEEAEKYFLKAIELRPVYADAWNNLGLIKNSQKNYLKALEYYNKALEYDPKEIDFYVNRIDAYKYLGKYDLAFDDIERIFQIDPDNEKAYLTRAILYQEQQKWPEALAEYDRIIQKGNVSNVDIAYINRGAIRGQYLEDHFGAIEDFTKAIEKGTKSPQAFLGRGMILLGLNNRLAAKQDFIQVLRLGKHEPNFDFPKIQQIIFYNFPELKKSEK